MVERPLP